MMSHRILPLHFELALLSLLIIGTATAQELPFSDRSAVELKSGARASFALGDIAKARQQLTSLLDQYRPAADVDPYLWQDRVAEVSLEYLRAGELDDVLRVLGEAADLELSFQEDRGVAVSIAAAGLHRSLAQRTVEERYEALYRWTMPTESRPSIRMLNAVTPTQAPPNVFARVLGERPRDSSFAPPAVGDVPGLFCSTWELLKAADESGNLRRLTAELSRLADEGVSNARLAVHLARIVATQREDSELTAELAAHADLMIATPVDESGESLADIVLGTACLQNPALEAIGERILNHQLQQTLRRESLRLRPFLRHALASAVLQPDSGDVWNAAQPRLWVASSTKTAWPGLQGAVSSRWSAHQDHIMHVMGSRNDYLFFKYPLTGDFKFSCETQLGGRADTDGGVAYGGLGYEVWADRQLAKVWDANIHKLTEFHCPFVERNPTATFNRFALESEADSIIWSVNGHPTWRDSLSEVTSPWIGLRSWGERAPVFRQMKISGDPVIPREVNLVGEATLRGWVSSYYNETTPETSAPAAGLRDFAVRMMTSHDWSASEGIIHGAKRVRTTGQVAQSRLYYFRPLLNDESVSYEFKYEPDKLEVHPALGRLAFLIEPGGVRLHWLTDNDHEWTGLQEDNAVVEPLNRRGPRPLPLKAGAWNQMTVELQRDTLKLFLNGEQIYNRRMEPESERTFGFYHDKNKTASRVRKVVLRGDWPEKLTDAELSQLASASNPDPSAGERRILGAIFDDRHIHGSVIDLHARAMQMPAEARYEMLAQWVLPNHDHASLRMAFDFTPTNPSPPILKDDPAAAARFREAVARGERRVTSGANLVAPMLDLVDAAAEIGRLDALRAQIEAFEANDDFEQRSRLSALALVAVAEKDFATANVHLEQLAELVLAGEQRFFLDRAPETLAIVAAGNFAETRELAGDMAMHILANQVRKSVPSDSQAWNQQMRAMASRLTYIAAHQEDPGGLGDQSGDSDTWTIKNWIPTSRDLSKTRGRGLPQLNWRLSGPASVTNVASHEEDFLFYRIPLRGDFEVECEVQGFGWLESSMWVAGQDVAPVYTLANYDIGTFRGNTRIELEPKLHSVDDWIRYRAVVRDGVCTTYFNGRKIHERQLSENHDPWLAIHSPWKTNGTVRDVRISGSPTIPTEVGMTANPDLPGWLPIHEGHRVGTRHKWQQTGDYENGGGIRGIQWNDLPDSHREALIRYHRPMAEDGRIEYEFFYYPGQSHVHPALDRLAFMLEPEGVQVHWVTDEQFDRTGLAPDNLFDEPDNRRGPKELPLKVNDWNRLGLFLVGDVVSLHLNGELVFERQLEPTNQRTFGLFHYANRTEALVRDVTWRGDWPRELPSLTSQELAGEGTEFLDATLADLTETFEYNFATAGLSLERFGVSTRNIKHFEARSDGLHVTRPGADGYNDTSLVPQLIIGGDFDIIAEFDQFASEPTLGGSGGVFLQAILESEKSNECLIYRRLLHHRAERQPIIQGSYVTREVGGARRHRSPTQTVEAPAGRLRLARRGETLYHLFAENDSPHFRLVKTTEAVATDDVGTLRLVTQTQLAGLTSVVWKNVSVRAERLSGLALQDTSQILAQLNNERDSLPEVFEQDFSKDPVTDATFQTWGPFQQEKGNGVRMISIGRDRWTSSGFNLISGLAGDFDVSLDFDQLMLATPKARLNSAFYIQVEFADAEKTQMNVIAVHHIEGDHQVYAQVKTTDEDGNHTYQNIRTAHIADISRLRLARRGKQISFLYRPRIAESDVLVAQKEMFDMAVRPYNVRFLLHTGGDDRQSEVMLKSFQVHADKIDPKPVIPTRSPGPLRSFLDLFR